MHADGAAPLAGAPTQFRGLTLFPFQQRALQAIFDGHSVVVAAPTGAGKTLVADYAIERALGADRRVVYTSPIKALSNQKFRDFREAYGDGRVGLMTGDVTMQPDAALLIMTTEIFRNTLFEDPARLDGFDFVIFDEVHYLDDRERGTVWEEAIIFAPDHLRIVALSATIPNVEALAAWISRVRGHHVDVIVEEARPVPLVHKLWVPGKGPRGLDEVRKHYRAIGRITPDGRPVRTRGGRGSGRGRSRAAQARIMDGAGDALGDYLEERDLLPAIWFCFSRRECEALARHHASRRELLKGDDRRRMLDTFDDLARRYECTDSPSTRELRGLAGRGVLFHHAGMLPIDKEIVERLFTSGRVRLLFATETFALGVNMPARSVCFQSLLKYDGIAFGPLLARQYWQMAGRAGRQGLDDRGHVFALLDDGEVDYTVLERLLDGRTEPVRSRFNLNYAAILSLYGRMGDRVIEAWERSFAHDQQQRWAAARHEGKPRDKRKKGRKHRDPLAAGPPKPARGGGARLIRSRLEVLRAARYLDDEGLTRKGRLCEQVNGYEIAVTEAIEGGYLFRCDPVQACVLFAAMVYESRPSDASARPGVDLRGIRVPFEERMAAFAALEADHGIRHPTRGPDFGLTAPVERWAQGGTLDEMLDRTTLAAGDLVRVLRMTIQLLRQAAHALPTGDPTIGVLHEARARLDRDVVDARRQLELG